MSKIFDSVEISEEVKTKVDAAFQELDALYEFVLFNQIIGKNIYEF